MSTTKDNVINVSFSSKCNVVTVAPRYQWDKGIFLRVENIRPSKAVFLHCSFDGQKAPAYVLTTKFENGTLASLIPNELFCQTK